MLVPLATWQKQTLIFSGEVHVYPGYKKYPYKVLQIRGFNSKTIKWTKSTDVLIIKYVSTMHLKKRKVERVWQRNSRLPQIFRNIWGNKTTNRITINEVFKLTGKIVSWLFHLCCELSPFSLPNFAMFSSPVCLYTHVRIHAKKITQTHKY